MIVILVLLSAYIIRIIYPNLYMTYGDMPGCTMASLRLHLTSIFETKALLRNSLVQILQFNHGYTVMLLPYFFYEIAFNLFKFPLTEANLVYVHSFIGLLTLISIFYFLRLNFGKRVATIATILLSVTPIHIGHSRAHIGPLMILTLFFYASLSFLYKYIFEKKKRYKILYFIITFFYIGSDNAFFLGLCFHLIYIYLLSYKSKVKEQKALLRDIYGNFYTLVFIFLPIFAYLVVTYILYIKEIESGFLLRLLSKIPTTGYSIGTIEVFDWMLELIGPIVLLLILSFLQIKRIKNQPKLLFLFVIFAVYVVLFSIATSNLQRNHIFYLLVPVVAIPVVLFSKRTGVLTLIIVVTFFYSLSMVYNLNIGIPTRKNYGSINHAVKNNDYGIKTLGYLTRKNLLNISRERKEEYGVLIEKIALFLDYEGAYYYLGSSFHDWVIRDIKDRKLLERYDTFILAYLRNINRERNRYISAVIKEKNLNSIGYVVDNDKILIELYSNRKINKVNYYDINIYNKKFDEEFGNLDSLPKLWFGVF